MRNFSRLTAALVALVLMALAQAASAADSWQPVRSDGDNFQAMFPGKTEFASRDVANNGGTQHTWQHNVSDVESYTLAAITYPEGALPAAPDMDFYKRILDGFAGGSECKLRGARASTLAGHAGVGFHVRAEGGWFGISRRHAGGRQPALHAGLERPDAASIQRRRGAVPRLIQADQALGVPCRASSVAMRPRR